MWLAPVQIVFATITNSFDGYAEEVCRKFEAAGLRCELDTRSEKISYKIRSHIMQKVPVIAVIGENEQNNRQLTLRYANGSQETFFVDEALKIMSDKCASPKI